MNLNTIQTYDGLKLPWDILLPIFELLCASDRASAARISTVCREGLVIARNALYKILHINTHSSSQLVLLGETLRKVEPSLVKLICAVVVNVPIKPAHTDPKVNSVLIDTLKIIADASEYSVNTFHIIWSGNQVTQDLGRRMRYRPLRALLCRYRALEVEDYREFPHLTHLVALHIAGAGRFSWIQLECPVLSHFACTFHHLLHSQPIMEHLIAPRLNQILNRAAAGMPPLTLVRFFIATSMLAEYESQIRSIAEANGTVVCFTKIPDAMVDGAMRMLATGLSNMHFDGSLWQMREISYDDVMLAAG